MPITRRAAAEHEAPSATAASPAAAGARVFTGPPSSFDAEKLITSMMESFVRMQAETNSTVVEALRSMQGNTSTPIPVTPVSVIASASTAPGGNFTRCTARFDGSACEPEVLEAYVDAVQVYKECAGVSDEHALRGLPMLLEGNAAMWWRGPAPASPRGPTPSPV